MKSGVAEPPSGPGERMRHVVAEACEPIGQFWPMKNFVHHNPLHGLEHMPFEAAVREARRLLSGRGYLASQEYRSLWRAGRITAEGVRRALARIGVPGADGPPIEAGSRWIEARDVCRVHLLSGIEELNAMVAHWTLGAGGGALERFQDDLPAETRQHIAARERIESGAAEGTYLRRLWESALDAAPGNAGSEPPVETGLPRHRTTGDWLEELAGAWVVEQVNDQMIKWVASFVDEGMAGWAMPSRERGFYAAWRELAPLDLSGRFSGIRDFSRKVASLPGDAEGAIEALLERLGVPQERWTEYLSRHLAQLPGWAGFIRWLGENPDYSGQAGHPADAVQYLAVRLFYEVELTEAFCRREWGIGGNITALARVVESRRGEQQARAKEPDTKVIRRQAWRLFRLAQFLELNPAEVEAISAADVQRLLGWLDAFPEELHGPVWLEAYEDHYREDLVDKLGANRPAAARRDGRPRAQVVFCIDVRSESFRRHLEAQGPYETLGFAGFFGVAMNHRGFDRGERFPLCPVLLTPKHAADEEVRADEAGQVGKYASGTRWRRLGHELFHDVKQNPVASFLLVDLLGFLFSLGLVGKTLAPRVHASIQGRIRGWFDHRVGTRMDVNRKESANGTEATGFTLEERAGIVEGGLRATGLTREFGRLVVLCGHGSVSDNNPYFGALHCGACGGKHGDANARAFATMANQPEVRAILRERGIEIPGDTWFVGAKHLTTTDRVEMYDVEDVPDALRDDLRALRSDWERAGHMQARERCTRIPGAPLQASPEEAWRHAEARSVDWANVRPEWGLSSNAAFLIGRRSLTRGVNLEGRVFLHSYDPEQDAEGKILEKIMTAPLIVGEWINMEHYFSGVDPWFWGSGSKVIHNVVAGVGVMHGSHGDLQTGLPLQTVNRGAAHHHEPMRLLTVIEAPAERISQVISKHEVLQHLFHNGWLNLVAAPPSSPGFHRYNRDGTWEAMGKETSGRPAGPVAA